MENGLKDAIFGGQKLDGHNFSSDMIFVTFEKFLRRVTFVRHCLYRYVYIS